MFLQLAHTRLDVFHISKSVTLECYRITQSLPVEEKFGMIQQIRRAALSVHLNIAEGCTRKSNAERKRFLEVSRGSLIEIDTAFDVAVSLKYCPIQDLKQIGEVLVKTFKILSGLISSSERSAHN